MVYKVRYLIRREFTPEELITLDKAFKEHINDQGNMEKMKALYTAQDANLEITVFEYNDYIDDIGICFSRISKSIRRFLGLKDYKKI